jgi:hypothetical protein
MRFWYLPLVLAGAAFSQTPSPALPTPPGATTASPAATPSVPPETVVAEVNGKKYTAAEVDKLVTTLPPQLQTAAHADLKRALGYVLMMKDLAEMAEKAHLEERSPLKEQMEYNRLTALSQAEINEVHNNQVEVRSEDQEKYYKDHPEKYEEAKVKVIYIAFSPKSRPGTDPDKAPKGVSEEEAKAKIEDLQKQIASGADFGKLAKENSNDKESAAKDGDFGVIKRTSPYPDAIKNAVFALKPGQVSEPVRQPNGFYLVRLESTRLQPYQEVRTQIFEELKTKGFNDWMQGLQKRFEVKVENQAYFAAKPAPSVPPKPR